MHASPFDSHALETVDCMESQFPQESRALVLASQKDISDMSNSLLPPWSRDRISNNYGSVVEETTP